MLILARPSRRSFYVVVIVGVAALFLLFGSCRQGQRGGSGSGSGSGGSGDGTIGIITFVGRRQQRQRRQQ